MFEFPKNTVGIVEKMMVTQVVPMGKTPEADSIPFEAPENLKPYVGTYNIPQAQLKLQITAQDSLLAIPDFVRKTNQPLLLYPDGEGWETKDGRYRVVFHKNDTGLVTRMDTYVSFTFTKGESAALVLEKLLEEVHWKRHWIPIKP